MALRVVWLVSSKSMFFGTCGAACNKCSEDSGVCLLCSSWVLSLFGVRYMLQLLRQCHSSTEIAPSTTSRWRESDLIGQDLSMGWKNIVVKTNHTYLWQLAMHLHFFQQSLRPVEPVEHMFPVQVGEKVLRLHLLLAGLQEPVKCMVWAASCKPPPLSWLTPEACRDSMHCCNCLDMDVDWHQADL